MTPRTHRSHRPQQPSGSSFYPQSPPPPSYTSCTSYDPRHQDGRATPAQEQTPLLPKRQNDDPPIDLRHKVFWLVVGALFFVILGYTIQTPLDSYYRQMTRETWKKEIRMHLREERKTREAWRLEQTTHEHWVEGAQAEKSQWEEDRRRRDEQDQRDREEHERRRSEIQWQGLNRGRCIRYGTREYTSILANVPLGFNAVEECANKEHWFNGRDVRPSSCEDPGTCGSVVGRWEIDFNEPDCRPSWNQIVNKGCWPYGSKKRRYDAELVNIGEWESWNEVCSSMSAQYGHVLLPAGQSRCTQCRGKKCGSGYWATWEMQDDSC
ncbi:hypothetical protein BDN70DRAFT_995151 [Pholiota conissans]|uniref:Uncharacterized protein n=1 Tax=Pholiota conissans TaxID=109636 RepID=A0A9P5YWN6_9AGAR|nr:hypothetical protein BDN70DRAFT_995151 [Pholiota conissans]